MSSEGGEERVQESLPVGRKPSAQLRAAMEAMEAGKAKAEVKPSARLIEAMEAMDAMEAGKAKAKAKKAEVKPSGQLRAAMDAMEAMEAGKDKAKKVGAEVKPSARLRAAMDAVKAKKAEVKPSARLRAAMDEMDAGKVPTAQRAYSSSYWRAREVAAAGGVGAPAGAFNPAAFPNYHPPAVAEPEPAAAEPEPAAAEPEPAAAEQPVMMGRGAAGDAYAFADGQKIFSNIADLSATLNVNAVPSTDSDLFTQANLVQKKVNLIQENLNQLFMCVF
jgi:hypothetical protein